MLLLDFAALSLLVQWTGGVRSPVAGFFVFHMVFASILLPRRMAYSAAAAAMAILAAVLMLSGNVPRTTSDRLLAASMALTLLAVVYLASRITRALRRKHRDLVRQHRRVRKMSRQMRRQERALMQHEKMVALGQMAAGVTHEIANPLASMDSLLQLAQRRPERVKPDLVEKLREQVSRIQQIIQQMRSFAHPDDAARQLVPVNEVVEQALNMLRFDARMKRTRVDRQFDPAAGDVPALPQALQQVLVNLIVNALDAMAEVEQPVLTIRTQRRDGHCTIEVTDNGHGVRPEHMRRLFEPFFTTKPVGKGTGLGLSISYSLIQRQGGHLSARSEVGQGTTFVIRLRTEAGSQNWETPGGRAVITGKSDG